MTDEEKEARGREARAIINNPIFQETLEKIKSSVIDKWASTPARDTEGREWLWRHYEVTGQFESLLQEVLNTGKIAEQSLKMKKQGNIFSGAFDVLNRKSA